MGVAKTLQAQHGGLRIGRLTEQDLEALLQVGRNGMGDGGERELLVPGVGVLTLLWQTVPPCQTAWSAKAIVTPVAMGPGRMTAA